MTLSPASTPRRRLDARIRNVQGTIILAGPEQTLELSEVSLLIWRSLDDERSLANVGAIVAGEYNVDTEEAVEDVVTTVATLLAAEVVDL